MLFFTSLSIDKRTISPAPRKAGSAFQAPIEAAAGCDARERSYFRQDKPVRKKPSGIEFVAAKNSAMSRAPGLRGDERSSKEGALLCAFPGSRSRGARALHNFHAPF